MRNKKRTPFSDILKASRKEAGFTQEAFAKKIGVSLESVRNWEQGFSRPDTFKVEEICNVLECDLDYLFGRLESKTHDLNFVSKYTGLSEESIRILHDTSEVDPFYLLTLSWIISNDSLLEKIVFFYQASIYDSFIEDSRYSFLFPNQFENSSAHMHSITNENIQLSGIIGALTLGREYFSRKQISSFSNSKIDFLARSFITKYVDDTRISTLLDRFTFFCENPHSWSDGKSDLELKKYAEEIRIIEELYPGSISCYEREMEICEQFDRLEAFKRGIDQTDNDQDGQDGF